MENQNQTFPTGNSGSIENCYVPFYPQFVPYDPFYRPWTPAPQYPVYPAQQGWVCPLCGAANAPHVSRCPCTPAKYVWTSGTLTISEGNTGVTPYSPSDTTSVTVKIR